MTKENDLEKARKRAEKRAKEIFKPAPSDIEDELKKEKTLGTPKNLVRPDDKNE